MQIDLENSYLTTWVVQGRIISSSWLELPEELDPNVLRTTECNLVWSNLITNVLRSAILCAALSKKAQGNCMYKHCGSVWLVGTN